MNPRKMLYSVPDYGSHTLEDIGRICHRIDLGMYPQGSTITLYGVDSKGRVIEVQVEGDLTKDTIQRITEQSKGLTCILTFEDLMSVGYPTVEQDWEVDVIHPMNEGYLIVPEPRKIYVITSPREDRYYGYYDSVSGKMEVFRTRVKEVYDSNYIDTLLFNYPTNLRPSIISIENRYKGMLIVGSCLYCTEQNGDFHIDLPMTRLDRYYGFDDLPLGNLTNDLKLKPYLNLRQHEIDSYRRLDSVWKGYFRPVNP